MLDRRYIHLLAVVLIAIVVAALISEGALRLIGYTYTPLRIELLGKNDWRIYHAFEDGHFIYDPDLFWRPKTTDPSFNLQGYRGRQLASKKPLGSLRVFALGDSNTLGWAGQNGSNWPSDLEVLLRQDNDLATVTNAGVWGFSSFQGLRRFKEVLTWSPDVVLVSFGANDGHRVVTSDVVYARVGLRGLHIDKLVHNLRLGQLLLQFGDSVSGPSLHALVSRVDVEDYKVNLAEIVRLATEQGIKVVLLTRPFIHEPPGAPHYPPTDIYNTATKELGQRLGVPVVDLYAHFDGQTEYFMDPYHFNEEGNRVAARVVYEHLHSSEFFARLAPVITSQRTPTARAPLRGTGGAARASAGRTPHGPFEVKTSPTSNRIVAFTFDRAAFDLANSRLGLTASVNRSTFVIGQTLTASATIDVPGLSGLADLYLGALLPDGVTVVFWTGGNNTARGRRTDLTTFRPYATDVPLATSFSRNMANFVSHQWSGSEPRGAYVLFNLATKAGALPAGVITNDAILGLTTAPFSFR